MEFEMRYEPENHRLDTIEYPLRFTGRINRIHQRDPAFVTPLPIPSSCFRLLGSQHVRHPDNPCAFIRTERVELAG